MSLADGVLSQLIPNLPAHLGNDLKVYSPIDGSLLATLRLDTAEEIETKIQRATQAFETWRDVPAPVRGELVRIFGQKLRDKKELLGRLVTLENGKVLSEGLGEVQEMIDICDFAVGLSRQLHGLTIASERPSHVMQENWLPLGPVGVISAFNFPVAVWAWNAALAWVCGDPVLWKPSDKTPLCALACQAIFEEALSEFTIDDLRLTNVAGGLSQILMGGRATAGKALVEDPRIPLVSATGSTAMGRAIAGTIAQRFGRTILELGGNNAIIVTPTADLGVALPSIAFGAVGTCGQRCTSTRRLIVHESIVDEVWAKLKSAYASITAGKIGDPLDPNTLVGPLIDGKSFDDMQYALEEARKDALEVFGGERVSLNGARVARYSGDLAQTPTEPEHPSPEHLNTSSDAYYVAPALARMPRQTAIVEHETFAPILFVLSYRTFDEACEMQNAVPQGLSSAIMTGDVREAELFKRRSDCGIANVNIGTSGAEIGGAFGGEKETGGGRESGSDSWKQYMRRQTSTTYYGYERPALAQGVQFDL
ncbi:MAG: aldehyde dehydrogenase family protein [Armatimonadetes bacterium]|nr:aldehyde dehydrogenase family protein [Armatimonadota bacterium]